MLSLSKSPAIVQGFFYGSNNSMGGGGSSHKEQGDTAEQIELKRQAQEEWARYQEVYVPVENRWIENVHKMGEEQTYQDMAGDVNTANSTQFTQAGQEQQRQLSASGVDPSSGKAQAANHKLSDAQAANTSESTSRAQHSVSDVYTKNLSNVVAMGKGQQTRAVHGLQDISRASQHEANQDALRESQKASIPAAVAGVGVSYLADNPDVLKKAFSPSDLSLMQASSKEGFSPMGGASSYGMED